MAETAKLEKLSCSVTEKINDLEELIFTMKVDYLCCTQSFAVVLS